MTHFTYTNPEYAGEDEHHDDCPCGGTMVARNDIEPGVIIWWCQLCGETA